MWSHVITFFTGAAALFALQKILPAVASEAWRFIQAKTAANRVVAMQLDPLLKAADELQGKLLSLAKEDFKEFHRNPVGPLPPSDTVDLCSTLYLFAQFWARCEIVRRASFHAELARNKRGASMLNFLGSLESKHVRLVETAWQRAIAESLIEGNQSSVEMRSFRDFVEEYESSAKLRRWFQPLSEILDGTREKKQRQRVLRYGVVVHSMIDTLDPKHHTTKPRPGYAVRPLAQMQPPLLTGSVRSPSSPVAHPPSPRTASCEADRFSPPVQAPVEVLRCPDSAFLPLSLSSAIFGTTSQRVRRHVADTADGKRL